LTGDEITLARREYVRENSLRHNDIARKNRAFQFWSKFAQNAAFSDSITVYFTSPERPLQILHECTGKTKLAKLEQAAAEGLPYLIRVPWDDCYICLFGTGAWRLDADERGLDLADLRLLILEKIDRERRKLESLRRRFDGQAGGKLDPLREPIPESVRMYVWRRDQGKWGL
jgi:hypothetical protein